MSHFVNTNFVFSCYFSVLFSPWMPAISFHLAAAPSYLFIYHRSHIIQPHVNLRLQLLLTHVCPVTGFCRCFAFQIGKICIRNCIVRNFQFRKFLPVSSCYNNPYDMFTSFDHLFSNRLKCAILKLSSEQE